MDKWVEHYSDLYSRQNVVTTATLDVFKCLTVMEDFDTEPTTEELNKTINSFASGNATGSDEIPPDLIGHCKTALLLPLREILYQCWKEGAVSQDMRDTKIVTLYKNKGERNDCNNYRGTVLWAKFSLGSYCSACRNSPNVSTQISSVVSDLKDQR
ncbi:unnamed protein product [Acanthosepion pharaonis]|uniref:Uncharacterized protein n=1 Tax=Acanthosepion pharaonis TaxID=158019 RepID=A0A812DYI0_ACAPH|nr:unnamed protein product [Sepia pharaonis]